MRRALTFYASGSHVDGGNSPRSALFGSGDGTGCRRRTFPSHGFRRAPRLRRWHSRGRPAAVRKINFSGGSMVRVSVLLCVMALLAWVLPVAGQQPPSTGSASESAASATPDAAAPGASVSGSGTTNFIPLWTNSTTLGNSGLFQLGAGAKAKVGIGTTKPASTLDVKGGGTIRGLFSLPTTGTATATAGFNSQPMDLAASVFNSSASEPVTQTFQWQAEPVGNDTSSASGSLNLLFAEGGGKFAETGLNITSNGQITFATGQSGSGLSNVDASELAGLAASAFAQLAAANTFTANQTVNGNVTATQLVSTVAQGTAPLQVTSSTQVPNLNASLLGGSSASAFQPAGSYAVLNTNMVFGYQVVPTNGGQATLMTIPNLGTVLVDCD